ncbi:MAG: GtrA family protein [Rhodospirillaceae bacterium]
MIGFLTKLFGSRQFALFVLVGGFAAGVNVVSRYLFNFLMEFRIAIVLAYLCGMVTAFLLSKRFVFEQSKLSTKQEFIRFGLVNVVAVIQVWLISVGLGEYLFPWIGMTFFPLEIAHMIGVSVPMISSYLGHKYFSFAQEKKPDAAGEAQDKEQL